MSTDPDYPTFTQRAGERQLLQVDFGPSLAEGDHLTGVPSVSTATLRGYSTAGSLAITNLAFETGATPTRVSFLAETMSANVSYRLDVTSTTQNSERKIVPVILKVVT